MPPQLSTCGGGFGDDIPGRGPCGTAGTPVSRTGVLVALLAGVLVALGGCGRGPCGTAGRGPCGTAGRGSPGQDARGQPSEWRAAVLTHEHNLGELTNRLELQAER